MFTRWSLRVSLACSLACSPLVLAGQEKSLPQQIADQLVLLAGGIHTGYRFNHAKGLVVTGTFTVAAGAPSVSRAAPLQGGTVPVTVRLLRSAARLTHGARTQEQTSELQSPRQIVCPLLP